MFSKKEFGLVCKLRFISRTNCVLSFEHEKFFITSGLDQYLAFSYLLAEKCSCSAMFSKKEFSIVSHLRF